MKKVVSFLIASIFVLVLGVAAIARPRGIDRREHNQQQRINRGIRSGELARREAARLEAELARIKIHERFARADGNLSYRERARLQRELNHESRAIYRHTHDRQDRTP
ncbi:MAG: hypothetical protein WAV20_07240 [Blastocatellia bacterium]